MQEKIYTIPVNEVFSQQDGCPFCRLFEKLEAREIDTIMGAAMMEPDIRMETNRHGFCGRHLQQVSAVKNRLSLGLTLDTHLQEIRKNLFGKSLLSGKSASAQASYLKELKQDCYVCRRIDGFMDKMFQTAVLLFERDWEFRKKLESQPFFCLPHDGRLLEAASKGLSSKHQKEFLRIAGQVEENYLNSLQQDMGDFVALFDYRSSGALPGEGSRTAIERLITLLAPGDQS